MAVCTKKLDFAASVKQRLDFLEYPVTEGMDEASVAELLLSPGEERLKVLEWLFSRYDERLEELLNTSQLSFGIRTESRLQRLLTAACSLCLCQSDDVDLIKGDGSLARQVNFIDRLLDLVCIREKSEVSGSSISQASMYMDALVSQDGFMNMFEARVDLLPRDIRAEIENAWVKGGWIRDRLPPQASLRDLGTKLDILDSELKKSTEVLEQLQEQVTLLEPGKENELVNLTHMLATVLKELHQLAEGFCHCYENQISQWCYQTPPELSDLGQVIKRVHTLQQKFVKLLENLNKLQQVHTKLSKTVRKKSDVQSQSLVQASREVSDTFQHCLTVLEETLHRTQAGFSSKHTNVLSL